MKTQKINDKLTEDIKWLSERFVGYIDKVDFQENLKDILFTNKILSIQAERQRLKEEIELLYVANPDQLNFKSKVMIILENRK